MIGNIMFGIAVIVALSFLGLIGMINDQFRTVREQKPKRKEKRIVGYVGSTKELPIYGGYAFQPEVELDWENGHELTDDEWDEVVEYIQSLSDTRKPKRDDLPYPPLDPLPHVYSEKENYGDDSAFGYSGKHKR